MNDDDYNLLCRYALLMLCMGIHVGSWVCIILCVCA